MSDRWVAFSVNHHEWLVGAGKWPSKHLPRLAHRGRVVDECDDGTLVVEWPKGLTLRHFPDNLQDVP